MSYDLSFTEEFFTGTEEPIKTDRPRFILEAIYNLPVETKMDIAINLFHYDESTAEIFIDTDDFETAVLEYARETNTCSNLNSPITVWIDSDFNWSIDVYD